MKHAIRFAVVLAIFAMIASLAPRPVQAQTNNFGLSDADAQLLSDGFTNFKAKSFQMNYSFKVDGTGIPDSDDVSINVTGSGGLAYDPAKLSAASANPTAAAGGITLSQVIKASAKTGTVDQSDNVEVRIVSGEVYFKDDVGTKGKWMKLSLADAIKQAQSMNPMTGGSSATSGSAQASKMQQAIMGLMMDPTIGESLSQIPTIPGFIVAKRGADQTVDDVRAATITVTFDFTKLVASPVIKPLVKAVLTANAEQSGQTANITDDQVTSVITLAKALLKKGTLTLTVLVGTTDKIMRGFGFNIDASVDTSAFNPSAKGPTNVTVDFLIKLSKLDQPVKVEPVADAVDMKMPSASK